ncbi:MAG: helix-turn-helix transcriptional regulator [Spirochaetes bacterium]|nr:helix-turn-helix transcriptional regulator [Spirochaetota bacterium]MBN2771252.1 helix-turn-helix transcriptional regulator [Spirochaetota bacterium]
MEENSIGVRIKEIRTEKNLTQTELAKLIGIARPVLNRAEKDNQAPSATVLLKFLNIGISIDWLLTGEGSMFLNEEKPAPAPTQLPLCRTTEECLESITQENIHRTRWFKELGDDCQFIVAAVNTPGLKPSVHSTVKGIYMGASLQSEADTIDSIHKKGAAG